MKNKNSPHVWGDLYVRKEANKPFDPAKPFDSSRAFHWNISDTMTVYDDKGRAIELARAYGRTYKPGFFHVQNHATSDRYAAGGHNWYMTTRFDVWANMPDGRVWHGALITGGDNSSFRMHPTKSIWALPERLTLKHKPEPIARANYNARSKVIHLFNRKGRRTLTAKIFDGRIVFTRNARLLKTAIFDARAKLAFDGSWPLAVFELNTAA